MQEMRVQSLGQKDSLEEEMATHSSILAWEMPWTEELDSLESMGSQNQTELKQLSNNNCAFLGNGPQGTPNPH